MRRRADGKAVGHQHGHLPSAEEKFRQPTSPPSACFCQDGEQEDGLACPPEDSVKISQESVFGFAFRQNRTSSRWLFPTPRRPRKIMNARGCVRLPQPRDEAENHVSGLVRALLSLQKYPSCVPKSLSPRLSRRPIPRSSTRSSRAGPRGYRRAVTIFVRRPSCERATHVHAEPRSSASSRAAPGIEIGRPRDNRCDVPADRNRVAEWNHHEGDHHREPPRGTARSVCKNPVGASRHEFPW